MDSRRRTEVCTYFDSHYLARGLALYSSLREHAGDLRLWVLCLDEECLRILRALALDGVVPVPLAELEESVPDLLAVKADRTLFEYYCTSTPAWLGFVLRRLHPGDVLLYMDADLFVFAGIDRVYRDLGNGSVLLTPHRFSPADKADEDKGIYNVGVLAFTTTRLQRPLWAGGRKPVSIGATFVLSRTDSRSRSTWIACPSSSRTSSFRAIVG